MPSTPRTLQLPTGGEIPNSPLPVLVYEGEGPDDPAGAERILAAHDWRGSWRDGVFDFHHFHSTAHEVLAVVAGEIMLELGGPGGERLTARAGDVLVLPAGTGHRRARSTADLLVVGAYPGAMDWDIRRGDPAEAATVARNLAAVPLPCSDPLHGDNGPLVELWAREPPAGPTASATPD